ncbi:uncharacterized protein LOC116349230 [Contarinia nasturtii]|uniref:uncharacterized protein LOC116349230 n=1 Tax=Contarinia nasturtii TaxID=265458 RepID=UPI0012D3D8B7|nr:uncharacterized protein LOC116349230 [Contarinia nasturtii]
MILFRYIFVVALIVLVVETLPADAGSRKDKNAPKKESGSGAGSGSGSGGLPDLSEKVISRINAAVQRGEISEEDAKAYLNGERSSDNFSKRYNIFNFKTT